jgi:hypothetical protein
MPLKVAVGISLALLLITGVLGLYNGVTEWSGAETALQKSVTAGVFFYGIVGFVAAYGLLRGREWSAIAAVIWTVIIIYVPGAAVIGYGGPDASLGAAAASSVASALIGLGVIWTAMKNRQSRHQSQQITSS